MPPHMQAASADAVTDCINRLHFNITQLRNFGVCPHHMQHLLLNIGRQHLSLTQRLPTPTGASNLHPHNTLQHIHDSSATSFDMSNNVKRAASPAASVTIVSSHGDAASESAAADHNESTSEYQHSGESEDIAVGSSKKPIAIETPQDMSDRTDSGEGSQTPSVVEQAEKNGKKRAGEEQGEGKQVKKAKTGEDNETAPGGEEAGEAKQPESVEGLRARANEIIKKLKHKTEGLKGELQGVREDLEEAKEARDEWRTEYLNLKKKDDTRIANKREKEKNEKARRNAVRAEDKKAIRADFEKDARGKIARAEKKLDEKLNTKVQNMGDDIEHKRKKIEDLTDELRNLKSDHRDEIRGYKEKLKEAEKEGGPKAIAKLKQKDVEMKEKDREVQKWKCRGIELSNTLNRLQSEVNAAKTGEQQSQMALDNTFREKDALQADLATAKREVASWKANAMHANSDGEIREIQWKAQFKQTTEKYRREVDSLKHRADACNEFQRSNKSLARQNERNNEQHLNHIRKLADTQNKLQLALIEKDRAKASEEILKTEQQKLADDNKRLREAFARANLSPQAVLTSSTADIPPAGPPKDHSAGQISSAIAGPPISEENREAAYNGTSASKSNSWTFSNSI
ncbi:hypothetical protein AC579_7001 [Pseudocercospora musae]|uniref:Uncharacterized protein n=1 Tax=Pseudocercospora musae TaxID=113226 RepID=A0A139I949_9PEZI|nr:hypothetical protein AC579_7001 [Pseudocercospora musae]